jgi:Rad3-related DNA helicase
MHYNALDETGTMRNEIYTDLREILIQYKKSDDPSTAKYAGWIMNTEQSIVGTRGGRKFEFKPVSVASHSEDALFKFGSQILMMSATIVDRDVFCRSVGLDPSAVAFKRIPSPFPVENRRVHFMPVGSMSRARIDATLPKMAEGVKAILAEHSSDKGIIHCVNYRIARALVDVIRDPRLLIHDATNRDEILTKHAKSKTPTVLVSPSMTEGIDLAGDLSRFQILVKVPFPFLGDEVVRRRMAIDSMWYPYQTARAVIQSLGRSVRSETDFAVSYILDEDWARFYRDNAAMFPIEFKDAIT